MILFIFLEAEKWLILWWRRFFVFPPRSRSSRPHDLPGSSASPDRFNMDPTGAPLVLWWKAQIRVNIYIGVEAMVHGKCMNIMT